MPFPERLPRYDPAQTYQWNYDHAPDPLPLVADRVPGSWTFCGLNVDSPLGIPAGPLLNGRWVLYYASLGYDVLVYKTVRSAARECYPLPNLLPVKTGPLAGGETDLPASPVMEGSWAVSFGMPSQPPDVWRKDVAWTKQRMLAGKVLVVSVVGTIQPGWSLDDLAEDYARCARWAVESGADAVETNYSCPNVATCDGQLYQDIPSARVVTERVREAVGTTPLLIKIGHVTEEAAAAEFLEALGPLVDGLAMTNSVAATVRAPDGSLYFDGQKRGICGDATRQASLAQTRLFGRLAAERGLKLDLVGVGGAHALDHVRDYLAAGAKSVHMATAAMIDPVSALRIRERLAARAWA